MKRDESIDTADAIMRACISPNVADNNLEPANVVDVIDDLASQTKRIASAITALAAPGRDASGEYVSCLTEAVMGITRGLMAVAGAIQELAEAVSDSKSTPT